MRTRKQLLQERQVWALAVCGAAFILPDGPVKQAMGSLAWHRYDCEPSPGEHMDQIAKGIGVLKGSRNVALELARVLKDAHAVRVLERAHP